MSKPPVIDHDPDERPRKQFGDGWLWWACWLMVALIWTGYLYFHGIDWYSVVVGAVTGGMFIAWSIDITGNRVIGSSTKK